MIEIVVLFINKVNFRIGFIKHLDNIVNVFENYEFIE
jgi:hypothetical protein